MSFILAVGATASIASAYGSSLPFTAASNAAETVLTMASTAGVAIGDYVEVTSGWGLLDGRLARIKALTANTSITLELINTSDTSKYPSGAGAGGVRKISTWTQLSQIGANLQVSGGDQEYADITTLMDRTKRQIPTTRTPIQVTLPTFFDPALAWVQTVRTAMETATPAGALIVYPNGSRTVGNAYWGMREVPTIEDSTLRGEVSLSYSAQPITYAT